MNRLQWQQLAERWLVDAERLLDDHRWSAAYYVAGYAVEFGLKACVLVRVAAAPEVIFETRKFSRIAGRTACSSWSSWLDWRPPGRALPP